MSEHQQYPDRSYSIDVDVTSALSYVLQQNAVALINQIILITQQDLDNTTLVIRSIPEVFKPFSAHISALQANQSIALSQPKLIFDTALLASLSENIKASIEIQWLNQDQQVLVDFHQEIDVLTMDTWGGERQPLELLASFSQPNAACLAPILRSASEKLQSQQHAVLNGYQDKSADAVIAQLSALWQALLDQDLHYIVSPASFIKSGQRIRLAKQVLDDKLACCLDSTLLFAALVEQAGLDGVVVIEQGHAYLGVWLNGTPQVDLLLDDVQALRKRLDLGEIVWIETTMMTQKASFLQAINTANAYFKDAERQQKFYIAIDIRQARLRGVRPISTQLEQSVVSDESDLIWQKSSMIYADEPLQEEVKTTRVDRWLRRLLDLSLRNKMLNFKDNRYSIPLQCSETTLVNLEDALANQQGFLFRSIDTISLQDVQRDNEQQHINRYVDENLSRHLLFSALDQQTLDKRLIEVFRASRTALEEGGANTLFLAIGFLEWKESERAKRSFRAPLLLIPVQITRETAKTGYRLFSYDDEPRFNSTLLQLLRQDFDLEIAGLHPLPTDDSGVDVSKILHLVKKAIVNVSGWEVKAEAAIGQFSFSKYLMWLDLSTRMDELKNQDVVNHLIETPREMFAKQDPFPQPSQLDLQYQPQQLFTPLSSDSSQLAAVMSAALGRTFVLSGPPGTGKSQTITNMISQCLADGKSVLFVSEKMAALDVVYRRLNQVGLGELCLQLHSSKSQKMEVLDQLRTRAEKNNDPYFLEQLPHNTEWKKLSDQLVNSRDELREHVNILHTPHSIGWSLYAAMSDELRYRETARLRYPEIDIGTLTQEQRIGLTELVQRAASVESLVDQQAKQVLIGFGEGLKDSLWSVAWQEQYQSVQSQLRPQIYTLKQHYSAWQNVCAFDDQNTLTQIKQDILIFQQLVIFAKNINIDHFKLIKHISLNELQDAQNTVENLEQKRKSLIGQYQPQIFSIDLNQLNFKWHEADAKFFPFSWFAKFQLRNLIKAYLTLPQRPTTLAVAHDLPILLEIQQLQQRFESLEQKLAHQLGSLWKGEESAWADYVAMQQRWLNLQPQVEARIPQTDILLQALHYAQQHELSDLNQAITKLEQSYAALLDDTTIYVGQDKQSYADIAFDEVIERQNVLQQYQGQWRHWLNWQALKHQLKISGLHDLSESISQNRYDADEVARLLNINLARQWISLQFSLHPSLNQFNSEQHTQKVLSFSQKDVQHQRASSEEIIHRWNKIFQSSVQFKEQWKVLNKELGKKRRHIPVRELMRQIPDVLVGLKPCLLMSPLSVAQYLDTEAKFDVVIFDEASQIPVWDAIGALARGKQSIVVGDNKQMPPTSFFGKGDSDEDIDDEEVTEDLESILDECLAAQLPELSLNWHYRSRYESLIQFSNQKYYKGSLFTFPAAVAKDNAVQMHMVNGQYDKGNTRTNLNEAKAIVAFILQHLESQLGHDQPLTLGVVTFNMTQQKLIEDLLDNELAQRPDLESLSKLGIEPLFVKNLENVQGDERDIILFSITYAKDQDGKMSMNFGALNRQGGQRRLNVAITRARRGLHVFSSLNPEEINLSRTNSEGVRDLKEFLIFARHGQLHLANSTASKPAKKELIQYLQSKLQAQGWGVNVAVGHGSSAVDLAIRDEKNDGHYIAGILVDGENYANAATVRDRDQLRPTVLKGLGWQLFNVWTVDWWLDAESNLNKLSTQLEQLRDQSITA